MTPDATTVDFTGVSLGISTGDLLTTTFSFIALFTGFILLGIAVRFAPQIVNFLMGLFRSRSRG